MDFLIADATQAADSGRRTFMSRVAKFPGWDLTITAVQTPRGPEIVELKVHPSYDEVPVGGIPARLLRAVSLDRIYRLILGSADLFEGADDANINAWSAARRPGKAGRGDYDYAVWAARYVAALSSPRPIADLAAQWHLSESQLRNIVHECRSERRGLLTKAGRGRAGGELTDKARQLLREGGGNR